MNLPHDTLVLVTDGRKMLLLRNQGDAGQIGLCTEQHDCRKDRKDRDIKSDAPGLTAQSAGYGRPAYDEPDYHQLEEDRWAARTATIINERALANAFDGLVVIAPPRTMGVLRKQWHQEVEKRILTEIAKEMVDRPLSEIEALLAGEGRPPGGDGN